MDIYTIGHSTHEQQTFIDMLKAFDIQVLVDVRSYPGSRKYPHFGKEVMIHWLKAAGIEYVHLPLLGGRRRKLNIESPNDGWRNQSFKNYADYTLTDEFEEGMQELLSIANIKKIAYCCAECLPWRCHRSIISDYLSARGHNIFHIMNCKTANKHKLTSFGTYENGKVIYPSGQLSLF